MPISPAPWSAPRHSDVPGDGTAGAIGSSDVSAGGSDGEQCGHDGAAATKSSSAPAAFAHHPETVNLWVHITVVIGRINGARWRCIGAGNRTATRALSAFGAVLGSSARAALVAGVFASENDRC